ncbi:LysR family transcriptional regulator [Paenibacillus vulneris]|uniref:LysR family transcriptional regulator n=1 Tax=Paenibacillus vulneris TaxID=1133364 RepID=A0ABW3UQE2_9BACL
MDMKALKTFQMIVKLGSFNRAAEELNYVQSTVTMQIQKLESDLGVQLMERSKKIRLTEAGRLLYEQSLSIVQQVDSLQTNISDLQRGEAGHVRLGVTEPTGSRRLPELLGKFLTQYPQIRLSVDFANTPALSGRLQQGELDIALCSSPDIGSGLYFEPLFKEGFVMLLPENHPLASKPVIEPGDIQGHRLLITSAACPYRKKLQMVLQESASVPIDTMEIGSMTALPHYVKSGLGIALVPSIALDPLPAGTIAKEVGSSLIDMTFGIMIRSPYEVMTSAGFRLYRFLKEELSV